MLRPTLAALALLTSADALACGGFFCFNVPIDQSKERIIFAIDEQENTVETHVQIFYQGNAEEFSWVVPVPAVPELGLSSDAFFQYLDAVTAPRFWLNWEERGTCDYDSWYGPGALAAAESDDSDFAGGPPSANGVDVIAQSQVGPYDQVTLRASTTDALLQWLGDNGYTIPSSIASSLSPYVASESYFIALKLQKDREVGDIAPIKFTYAGTSASIPIVLTAIAATPDMRLQPYVLASSRAVPDNYLHVQINEAAIDWMTGGSNYDAVITQAANEAGGQAFATDFAGSTVPLRDSFYAEGRFNLGRLRASSTPAAFVQELLNQGFPRNSQVQALLREFIPMPQALVDMGLDEPSFYGCLECYAEHLEGQPFDPVAFTAALDELILQPMAEAEQLLHDHPFLTRLTSSMSPDEMTSDPIFALNNDMSTVSNQHEAKYIIDCGNGGKYSEAPQWIELQDGTVILMPPGKWYETTGNWSYTSEDLDDVGAQVVEDARPAGAPVLVADNTPAVDESVESHNAKVRAIYRDLGLDLPASLNGPGGKAACGCDTASPSRTWLAAGLLALGLRRRRA